MHVCPQRHLQTAVALWLVRLDALITPYFEVGNSDILEKLKISYDDLEYNERKFFLDIACFFNMRHKDHAREALDGCGFYADIGIDILVEKALLGIDSYGFLRMHDLLQEKGQEVVRRESPDEPGRRNRLWNRKEVNYVLSQNTVREFSTRMSLIAIG